MPSYYTPWPCVVLGIDPGRVSGWGVMCAGEYHSAGTCRVGYDEIVHIAQQVAVAAALPLIVVAEEWGTWIGKGRSVNTLTGLRAAWRSWEEAIARCAHPKRRIVRVTPAIWRPAFNIPQHLGSDVAKERAIRAVKMQLKVDLESHDAAEALCIALWGTRAAEVGAVLPKKRGAK